MTNRLDIIIFAATGFTGKRTIPQLTKLIKGEKLSLTWGIAGRSEDRLKQALSEMEKKTGEDYSQIPIILADVNDIESIENMTARAKVIINAVGPYRFFGERIVKACVKTGTHHVDVSGEPQFLETIQLKYHEAAKEKGIFLISACGLDSIPGDLGVIFMQQNFEGTLNSIESYMSLREEGGPYPGASVHYTTYESAVHGLTHYGELRAIRKKLYPTRIPEFEPKLAIKGPIFKSDVTKKWSTVFPGSDRSVMLRTQRFMYETYNKRPAQIRTYVCFDSIFHLFVVGFFAAIFAIMCKISFTRNLLLKYPKFFTCGMFSHEGPTEERQENTFFDIVFYGKGWSEKLPGPMDNYTTPPDKTITAKVSGRNPGYGATCLAFALSAVIILTEGDKMPNKGGCYPPGAAFQGTSMIEKLNKHGVHFELNPQL